MRYLISAIATTLFVIPASAQVERFELGQRVIQFEKAWDQVTDAASRKRAVAPLQQAMKSFFSLNPSGAAEALDHARHSLSSDKLAGFETRWADALTMQPQSRFLDAKQTELEIAIKRFYKVDGDNPKKVVLRLRLDQGALAEFELDSLPKTVKLPLVDAPVNSDFPLRIEIVIDGRVRATRSMNLSRVTDRDQRLKVLREFADKLEKPQSLEPATLKSLTKLLTRLAENEVMETDYPASRLLTEAESLTTAIRKDATFYTPQRSGQFWLTIPAKKEDTPVRLLVPKQTDASKPVPLLVALHGMGGSENLFFDGYGDGIAAKLCDERGWLMVSPRAGGMFGFGGPPNVTAVVEELAKRYPIDRKRVYLVGHSMGAAHAVALAQQTPEAFAGVAALGGGGAVRNANGLTNLPFFIGCGKADFALGGARNLANALEKAKVKRLQLKEYDDIEHMVIVRKALADVFRFWEQKNEHQ